MMPDWIWYYMTTGMSLWQAVTVAIIDIVFYFMLIFVFPRWGYMKAK